MSATTGTVDFAAIADQCLRVLPVRHGDADDVDPRGDERGDLLQGRVDVGRLRGGHRLDADGCVAADRDGADVAV